MTDDAQTSREERCFRLWINSLEIDSYVNNLFEDVRTGWVLLEVLDKISPANIRYGSCLWFLLSNAQFSAGNELCGSGVSKRTEAEQYGEDIIVLKKLSKICIPTLLHNQKSWGRLDSTPKNGSMPFFRYQDHM